MYLSGGYYINIYIVPRYKMSPYNRLVPFKGSDMCLRLARGRQKPPICWVSISFDMENIMHAGVEPLTGNSICWEWMNTQTWTRKVLTVSSLEVPFSEMVSEYISLECLNIEDNEYVAYISSEICQWATAEEIPWELKIVVWTDDIVFENVHYYELIISYYWLVQVLYRNCASIN